VISYDSCPLIDALFLTYGSNKICIVYGTKKCEGKILSSLMRVKRETKEYPSSPITFGDHSCWYLFCFEFALYESWRNVFGQ
jgi:hypothetical protein